ncbi:MAG TPA: CarD family transcriptional regulator [bacterium]|nr:CarD family transcriptional regulator [bacterium]
MAFQIGDVVVKPSLGICKIRAKTTLTVEGKQQEFFVIYSGDVRVLVPVEQAKKGTIRHVMSEKVQKKVLKDLQEPLRLPTDQHGDILEEAYRLDADQSNAIIKERDPEKLCGLIRLLFNKMKDHQQLEDKAEQSLFSEALSLLSEELAYLEKTIKGRMTSQIKQMLAEARKKRKKEKAGSVD